jgi:hypothetical protein
LVPGTNNFHPDGITDIADNVFDLQVAFGIDVDLDGRIDVEDAGVPLAKNLDEWRYNAPGELDDDDSLWPGSLQQVRLSIVGQAQTADRQYVSPAMSNLENRVYGEDDTPDFDEVAARRYRRRILQSSIDLRNL